VINRTIAAGRSAVQDLRRGGYRQVLRWVALPVTNRRWAAPLSALALGFGLFVGVAIGPSAAGTLATGAQIIEIPLLAGAGGAGGDGSGGGSAAPAAPVAGEASGNGSAPSGAAFPSLVPVPPGDSGFTGTMTPAGQPSSNAGSSERTSSDLAVADAVAVGQPDALTESECADMATILWQIYLGDSIGLPFSDMASLQASICPAA
jgi:hypothetical protein